MMKKTPLFSALLALIIFPFLSLSSQSPQGCFILDFQKKNATIPSFEDHFQKINKLPIVVVDIDHTDTLARVSKYVYGNNANPYMTQMITESALLGNIRKLSPNIIRFPGGNISSVYFWNSDKNVPPSDVPSKLLNSDGSSYDAGYWYGKNTESWTISLDNYYKMLTQTDNTGMITINYSYARYGTGPEPAKTAAHYAADWVRYDHGKTKFWEIGNENDGPWEAGFRINTATNHDGQPEIITGELYGEHFNIFADSMRAAAAKLGYQIYIGAQVLPYDASTSWNVPDQTWNDGFFSKAGNGADFFIVHNYFTPYNENSPPDVVLSTAQTETGNMMDYFTAYISGAGLEMKPLALTEWNIFAVGSKQMCSYINGIHSAIVLGELIKKQYGEASRWDLANGYSNGDDMGLFNNKDETGIPAWNPRPAFFYMYFFQKYFGDHMIRSTVTGSQDIIAYASTFTSGETGIVIVNKSVNYIPVKLNMPHFKYGDRYFMYSLTGGTDNGSFSQRVYVNEHEPSNLTGGPIDNLASIRAWSRTISGSVVIASPPRSVQYILVDNGNKIINDVDETRVNTTFIYPNPATDRISVMSPFPVKKAEIISVEGVVLKTILPGSSNELKDISLDLSPGIYFIKIFNTFGVAVDKLIINK
jgi:Alpha-L-arabinofuranosidase